MQYTIVFKCNTRNKYTMCNNNMAIYTGYQCQVEVLGYDVIEVDMYI